MWSNKSLKLRGRTSSPGSIGKIHLHYKARYSSLTSNYRVFSSSHFIRPLVSSFHTAYRVIPILDASTSSVHVLPWCHFTTEASETSPPQNLGFVVRPKVKCLHHDSVSKEHLYATPWGPKSGSLVMKVEIKRHAEMIELSPALEL